jgi:GntR family transcriptional regulator
MGKQSVAKIHDLRFSINPDGDISVYVQIENNIQFAIASGRLKPGDTLPSVREMAQTLQVNPNTITKAYRDLELMNLVTTRRGVGVTVTEKAVKYCRDGILATVNQHLEDAVSEGLAAGYSPDDVRKIVNKAVKEDAPPYSVKKNQ